MASVPHDVYEVNDDGSVTLDVHAQPGAGRSHIAGRHGDAVKIRVAVPPEAGRANTALVSMLAEAFGVREKDVELVSGDHSRAKRFRLRGIDVEEFDRLLDQLLAAGAAGPGPSRRDRDRPPRRR